MVSRYPTTQLIHYKIKGFLKDFCYPVAWRAGMDSHIYNDLTQAKAFIDEMDLTPVIDRLVNVEGWTRKQAIKACQQYKNYLFLIKKYGNHCELPPSADVDEVWHAHILHTESYTQFCNTVFGKFLHHLPEHISRDNTTSLKQSMNELFEKHTQTLYCAEFGEAMYRVMPGKIRKMFFLFLKQFSWFHFLSCFNINHSRRKHYEDIS